MPQKTTDLYLYLAKRDKSGIRILAKFKSNKQLASRLNDLADLPLPNGWNEQINQIIFDSRMLWEPWIESADSFEELRLNLKIRKYSNIPTRSQLEFTPANVQVPVINLSKIPSRTTMLKKNKF